MTEARLNTEQRRALALLAGAGANGVTDTIMPAQGVTLVMLGVLVVKGLAIVRWKPVRAGGKTIEVGRFRITPAGGRALARVTGREVTQLFSSSRR